MAKESKKLKRTAERPGKEKLPTGNVVSGAQAPVDPMNPDALKAMAWRVGLILLAVWFVGAMIAGFAQSSTLTIAALAVPGAITVVVLGVVYWALKRAKKASGVAGILAGVENERDRKAALEQLESGFKAEEPAAIFAKAQLLMQEDPRQALTALEQINLSKAQATVADEARAQRGMIHLMIGEAQKARDLADGIDLSRHQDEKSKAMMASVIAESWARTGQAKRAVQTIELYNPEDGAFEQLRPQLYRARAYAYAYANDPKAMKRALRKLLEIDVRLLGGFVAKKTHPLLQREAKQLLERSGQVPRKMQIQRG